MLSRAACRGAALLLSVPVDDDAVWAVIDAHPGMPVSGLRKTDEARALNLSADRFGEAMDRLEKAKRVVNGGSPNRGAWCSVTLTGDPMSRVTRLHRGNADGVTVVGSPKYEAEVARCVAVIADAVLLDEDKENLPETKMYLALGGHTLTLRSVFVVAYERWKSDRGPRQNRGH